MSEATVDRTLETLARFCDPERDTGKYQMAHPFARAGWVYATNSKVVVRVEAEKLADPPPPNDAGPPAEGLACWNLFPLSDPKPLAGLTFPADVECKRCKGAGKTETIECPECGGDGEVEWDGDYSHHTYSDECQLCDGAGEVPAAKVKKWWRPGAEPEAKTSQTCEDCDGTGRLPSTEPVEVGGQKFAADLLRPVAELPDVVAEVHTKGGPKLVFKSGDIEGMLVGLI